MGVHVKVRWRDEDDGWTGDGVMNLVMIKGTLALVRFDVVKASKHQASKQTQRQQRPSEQTATMHSLIARSGALEINPQAGATHLSENGSSWLYAVTALFGFSFVSGPLIRG
jgi:hypothetical protein